GGEAARIGDEGRPTLAGGRGLRREPWVLVEAPEATQIDLRDVASDAPLAEGERHPGLEALQDPGLHLRMGMEVVVETIGPGVHESLEPVGALIVEGFHLVEVDEEPHPEVLPDSAFTFSLGEATLGDEEVAFDAGEIVLRLRVHQPEDRISIRGGVDMR